MNVLFTSVLRKRRRRRKKKRSCSDDVENIGATLLPLYIFGDRCSWKEGWMGILVVLSQEGGQRVHRET